MPVRVRWVMIAVFPVLFAMNTLLAAAEGDHGSVGMQLLQTRTLQGPRHAEVPLAAHAGMRTLQPIGGADNGGNGAEDTVPVAVEAVEAFIHQLAQAWNTRRLGPLLAPDFPGRERVLRGFDERVVPGTRLQVLSVGPVQTVEQERRGHRLSSVVLARVRVQLETPLPDGGFEQQASTQELLIRVVGEAPP